MRLRAAHIERSIQQVREIYEAVDMLAYSQDKALLDSPGLESTSSEDSDEEADFSDRESPRDSYETIPDRSLLVQALNESNFNWFEFHEKVESMMKQWQQ